MLILIQAPSENKKTVWIKALSLYQTVYILHLV